MFPVNSRKNRQVSLLMDHHLPAVEMLIMINRVTEMGQPLRSVHITAIIIGVVKYVRQQHVHRVGIVLDLGLVPRVFQGQNPRGFISRRASILGREEETEWQQDQDKGNGNTRSPHSSLLISY